MPSAAGSRQLAAAAAALGDLAEHLVFVGGATTFLLITDAAAREERATQDTDAIVNPRGTLGFHAVEAALRRRGFTQRPGEDHPICRWFHGDVVLDVMPDDERILGFSNRWYRAAYDSAEQHEVDGQRIRCVSAVYFVATKLEAFAGRGRGDYQASHDLEDLISVVDGRSELVAEMAAAPDDVRAYVSQRIGELLDAPGFVYSVPAMLGYDLDSQARAPTVLERLARLAGR